MNTHNSLKEVDTNHIPNFLIFNFKDLWSQIGSMEFEAKVEQHINRIYITALAKSEKNKSNYLKEQIKIFQVKYQGEKVLEFYTCFLENTLQPNVNLDKDINKAEFLSWLFYKNEEIRIKSEDAIKAYKILSHNLNKKNYVEIDSAEKSFFSKEVLLKSAMNKTYETLFLYHITYLKRETYNCLLLQFNNASNKLITKN